MINARKEHFSFDNYKKIMKFLIYVYNNNLY